MGILNNITNQMKRDAPSTSGNPLVSALISLLANQSQGGISGLIQRFSGAGLGEIVNSWVSPGLNKPVTPQQVQQGLGQDTISQLAQQSGMDHEEVKSQLAQVLPQVVDRLTPNGLVPTQVEIMSKGKELLKSLF